MSQIISTPLQYLHLWMTWKGGGMHLLLQEDLAVSSQLNRWCTYSIIFSTLLPGCFGLFSGSFSTQLYSFAERSRLHWVPPAPLTSSHSHAAVTLVVRDSEWVAPRYSWLLSGYCWSCWSPKQSPGAMLAWLHCDNWLCMSSAHDKRRLRPWWNTFMLTHFS